MIKPKTNREAFVQVLRKLKAMSTSETLEISEEDAREILVKKADPWRGAQSELARRLGISKQLVSRWEEVPLKYVIPLSGELMIPVDWIVPELDAEVTLAITKLDCFVRLIRIFTKDASPCPKKRKSKRRSQA